MDCSQARDLLSAYLDEALDKGAHEEVKKHLSRCGECRKELEALRSVVKDVRALGEIASPGDFLDNVHARIRKARTEPALKRLLRFLFFPWPVKIPIEAVSVVAVAVIVFTVFRTTGRQDELSQAGRAAPEQAITGMQEDAPAGKAQERTVSREQERGQEPLQEAAAPVQEKHGDAFTQQKRELKQAPRPEVNASAAPAQMQSRTGKGSETVLPETDDARIPVPAESPRKAAPAPAMLERGAGAVANTAGQPVELSLLMLPAAESEPAPAPAGEEVRSAPKAKDGLLFAPAARKSAETAEDQPAEKERKKASAGRPDALQKQESRTYRPESPAASQVRGIIAAVHGSLISSDCGTQHTDTCLIIARIPGERLDEFYGRLEKVAEFTAPARRVARSPQDDVLVKMDVKSRDSVKK